MEVVIDELGPESDFTAAMSRSNRPPAWLGGRRATSADKQSDR
jgi:hypothetical protein